MNVSAREGADLLGVSERTIRRWIGTGDLPATKRGRAYAIDRDTLYAIASAKVPSRVRIIDPELAALETISMALSGLGDDACGRVLEYAVARFGGLR